ncbi:GNAT family N-acetyltransferase [Croceimicrobium sp.]|uniref:GNAT family N-acetyltransferase n=1 Tax=Croceimicrobium sp. TaxID=2828340 RepID=UPI003BA8E9E4
MAKTDLRIERTNSKNPDFIALVQLLDAELVHRDGPMNSFYHQFNGIEDLKQALLLYQGDQALACGAFKNKSADTAEVKRMYVVESQRSQGLASQLLAALEDWARELALKRLVLETGINQPEAIRLYEKNGYQRIPNYPPYEGVDTSYCFEKIVN